MELNEIVPADLDLLSAPRPERQRATSPVGDEHVLRPVGDGERRDVVVQES